jgi:exopolysaccharide biosynthesis polyprenyl glycosylphosphotransferase
LRGDPREHGFERGRTAALAADAEVFPVWEAGRGVVLKRNAFFTRALVLGDILGAYIALLFAVLIVGRGSVHMRPAAVLIGPFVVLASKVIGLYDRDPDVLRKTTIDEVPSILNLSVLYALTVWFLEAFLFHGWLARPQVFALAVASFGLITLGRLLARTIALAVTPAERCIILGNATDAERIANKLAESRSVDATVIGRVALRVDERNPASRGSTSLGDVGSLGRILRQHDIERVIIAPGAHDQEEILDAIRLVTALNIKVSVLPRLLEVVGSSSAFEDINGIWLLGVRQYGLSRSSAFLKRVMDIAGAAIGLILLAPLLLMLAMAIKLDTGGPVFFRQSRIGRSGERFWMLKFRSMVPGADQIKETLRERNEAEGGLFKISDDPRITRVGRFLRRTSLDELPQLLTVLKGDMSLVGPRPLVQDEDALIEGWQRRRLAVKSGMTGPWQIFGSSRIPMNEMVKIDYIYGANWSLWLDLKILLKTVPYVLSRSGL